MTSTTRIELDFPATGFTTAFPLGNGWLGAMFHGTPGVEELDLNVDTLWSGGPGAAASDHDVAPDVLSALRSAIAEGEFSTADELARYLQFPGWSEAYQPLGRLRWQYTSTQAVQASDAAASGLAGHGYRRELDLAHAVAAARVPVRGGAVTVEAFVSAPAGVLVVEVTGPDDVVELLPPQFVVPHEGVRVSSWRGGDTTWTQVAGRAPEISLPEYEQDRKDAVVYGRHLPDAEGLVDAGMGFAATCAVQRTGPGTVRLVLSAHTGFRGHSERPSADVGAIAAVAAHRVADALARPTDALRQEHVVDHRRYFDRVSLRLRDGGVPDPSSVAVKAERYFNVGRYLLIACSRPGTQAANLQGIWNVDLRPGWSSNYTTNINTQMNYWGAEVAGLPELHEPMVRLVLDCVDTGTRVARACYQAPGSCTHHNTDLWRFGWPVLGEPYWANWQSGQQWMAAHVWEHYQMAADREFGEKVALPVHRAQAQFVLSQLVRHHDGRLVVSPSTAPEHRFRTPDRALAAVSAGSAMDQELAWEVLSRFVDLAAQFPGQDPGDAGLAQRCREALDDWREPVVSDAGLLQEWSEVREGLEPGHRHLSLLYGLFPGERITETGTPEQFAAARAALLHRLRHGSGHTSWSQAWLLCLAARLRDPDRVRDAILGLHDSLSSPSLMSLHPHDGWPGGALFQIDGNLGAVRGIAEMLVQRRGDTVVLLPALPAEIGEGSAAGLRLPGRRRIDLHWAGGLLRAAHLHCDLGGPVAVEFPDPAAALTVTTPDGDAVPATVTPSAVPGLVRVCWTADAGSTAVLRPTTERC